jgi:hypothetical protein
MIRNTLIVKFVLKGIHIIYTLTNKALILCTAFNGIQALEALEIMQILILFNGYYDARNGWI